MTTTPADPIRLELVKSALLAITDEMSGALRRTAYSTNIKTRGDFSCALLDSRMRVVAQSFSQPTHLGSLVHSAPRALAEFGPERLGPGDGIIVNDAHRSAVHLNDIAMLSPVDRDGKRLGYVANVAHHVDVGGSAPGSLGVNTEIFQEGLVIPPLRLLREGEIDPDVARLVSANVRTPKECLGDFRAQVAANQLAARRLTELAERYGPGDLDGYMDALIDYSDRRVGAALAEIPDGTYSAEDFLDDDGFGSDPIRISLTARISEGSVTFDLRDCAPQTRGPMNCTAPMAFSGVAYVLRALLPADIPVNGGFYRHVDMRTDRGTVVDAAHPAAVAGGWEVSFRVAETALRALAPVFPDRIPAATKGIICNVSFGGRDPATGEGYAYYETIAGGYGARAASDGMDGVQSHIHNTENAPIEEIELHYPVRFDRFALIPDSGGAGRFRGGLGVRRDYWFEGHEATFSIVSDRTKHAPWGLDGGAPGRPARFVIDPDGEPRELGSKSTVTLAPGEVISIQTPGGGGHGDPSERDPQAVARDVRLGKVRPDTAARAYGVVINAAGRVDEEATSRARAERGGRR